MSIFVEWQSLREVQVRVLDCGGLFKDYDSHKVTALSADIAGMDALPLNNWLSKFVMEVAKTSDGRYPPRLFMVSFVRSNLIWRRKMDRQLLDRNVQNFTMHCVWN